MFLITTFTWAMTGLLTCGWLAVVALTVWNALREERNDQQG